MGITEIMRRIWLFSAEKIKSYESFSKQPTQLIVQLNSSLQQIIDSHQCPMQSPNTKLLFFGCSSYQLCVKFKNQPSVTKQHINKTPILYIYLYSQIWPALLANFLALQVWEGTRAIQDDK